MHYCTYYLLFNGLAGRPALFPPNYDAKDPSSTRAVSSSSAATCSKSIMLTCLLWTPTTKL
jgi:hypothetical protein